MTGDAKLFLSFHQRLKWLFEMPRSLSLLCVCVWICCNNRHRRVLRWTRSVTVWRWKRGWHQGWRYNHPAVTFKAAVVASGAFFNTYLLFEVCVTCIFHPGEQTPGVLCSWLPCIGHKPNGCCSTVGGCESKQTVTLYLRLFVTARGQI